MPSSLRAEMARAAAEARPVWAKAKAESDFASFLPALERIVELKLRYVECFGRRRALRRAPRRLRARDLDRRGSRALRGAEAAARRPDRGVARPRRRRLLPRTASSRPSGSARSRTRSSTSSATGRTAGGSTRPSIRSRPAPGGDDVRITTKYEPDSLESLFSTMHEYGHGLYSHQLPPRLQRLPTGRACSLGIHESQSRLWENLVGRSLPFWRFFYPRLQATLPGAARRGRARALPRARSTASSRRSSGSRRTRSPTACT